MSRCHARAGGDDGFSTRQAIVIVATHRDATFAL
jgi:hypothetical protein